MPLYDNHTLLTTMQFTMFSVFNEFCKKSEFQTLTKKRKKMYYFTQFNIIFQSYFIHF